MQEMHLANICRTVIHFFKKTAKQLGKETRFVERESKLNANLFVETLVIGSLSNPTINLEQMCELMIRRGVSIKKQGFHKRFNKKATQLMQQMFAVCLKEFVTIQQLSQTLKPLYHVRMFLADTQLLSKPLWMPARSMLA